MLTEASTYDELYRNFRWDIPARFNMATACCDRHADGTGRLALIYVDEDGATTRTSFDEVAEMSRRFANVLKADGLVRGDRVAVFLSQSLELPIAHLAAFRSGMISIPWTCKHQRLAVLLATTFLVTTASAQRHRVQSVDIKVLSTMLADTAGIGEWGFSALVIADGHRILFDTGARPETVRNNARELRVDLTQ